MKNKLTFTAVLVLGLAALAGGSFTYQAVQPTTHVAPNACSTSVGVPWTSPQGNDLKGINVTIAPALDGGTPDSFISFRAHAWVMNPATSSTDGGQCWQRNTELDFSFTADGGADEPGDTMTSMGWTFSFPKPNGSAGFPSRGAGQRLTYTFTGITNVDAGTPPARMHLEGRY